MKAIEKKKLVEKEVHLQAQVNPHYPFHYQSEWLPSPGSESMQAFFKAVKEVAPCAYPPSIEALNQFFEENPLAKFLVENACKENENIKQAHAASGVDVIVPRIVNKDEILNAFTAILTWAPHFVNDDLVGLPFSAYVVGIDPTLSGSQLFGLP